MPAITNQMLNEQAEENCRGITLQWKHYQVDQTWVKRSLRQEEWQINPYDGTLIVPRFGKERAYNEASCLKFIAEYTDIPVPKLHCCFEDSGVVYLIMEYIDGVGMSELGEYEQRVVAVELRSHLQTMRNLTSMSWGGPSGIVVLPQRLMRRKTDPKWNALDSGELVFCHNDLSTDNVIVDPKTLKVKAILDWEYAGFYPEEFEIKFFERLSLVAL